MSSNAIVTVLVIGLWTGTLARFAVPGPDPMPIWLTLAIGLTGSIIGAVAGNAIAGDNGFVISLLSFGIATGLVIAYRRFVQGRPAFGAGALEFPEKGLGVEKQRERFRKLGIDPNALHPKRVEPDPRQLERTRLEAMLQELHRAGVLDDDELAVKRAELDRR